MPLPEKKAIFHQLIGIPVFERGEEYLKIYGKYLTVGHINTFKN